MRQDDTMASWDAIANSFNLTRRKPWPVVLDFLNNRQPTDTIMDLGCGNGRHLFPAARQAHYAIGVDFSRNLLNLVNKKLQEQQADNISLVQADLVHLPFCDGTADVILFIAALHNIRMRKNRQEALREVHRVMKPSATALISVWSRWQDAYRTHFLKERFRHRPPGEFGDIDILWRQHRLDVSRFYHLYSRKEFAEDLAMADLEVSSLQAVKLVSRLYPDNYFAVVTRKQGF